MNRRSWIFIPLSSFLCLFFISIWPPGAVRSSDDREQPSASTVQVVAGQSQEEADRKSGGCVTCHSPTDSASMHLSSVVRLGCVDCHGGSTESMLPSGTAAGSPEYEAARLKAHVSPRWPQDARSSANPVRAYTNWLRESPEYIQFVNPGDLRIATRTCGTSGCHELEVRRMRTSMMTHGAMLYGAALYNNGSFPLKNPHFGQSYDMNGNPQKLQTWPPPTPEETRQKGILPDLQPLERWEVSQPGNVLRVFERGGGARSELGNPNSDEEPGRPDNKLSDRGFGTLLRTDPGFLALQKTRLFDPLLYLPGTNDQAGDYRGSGCTGCHVVYANDRDPAHSDFYAKFGKDGRSATVDPTIPKNESGHPIRHVLTRSIPSSQCVVCHMHPGTNMVASYFGYTWWDNEVDGEKMYPAQQRNPSEEDYRNAHMRNPEAAAAKGLWSDAEFLKKVGTPEFNQGLKNTQFADFNSHGWVFRAVFKQDRKGNLLDEHGQIISPDDAEKFKKAVQLKDIHLEKGMHCVDCHFYQDVHGNGKLYGETRNAIEISCADCHGTVESYATPVTSGPAVSADGEALVQGGRTPWRELRFHWKNGHLFQRSAIDQGREWEVVQVKDTITPGNPHYNEKSRLAKTILNDGTTWGSVPNDLSLLAHADSRMTCFSCHSSWTTSCFGCHLKMTANQRMPMLQNEGTMTRNWTEYDFQVLRNDMYMLGIDGTVTGNKVAPVRSACAVVVSSQNQNRDWLYYGQQTVSAEGFSGQAFSPYVPHTVRSSETKTCTDCHVGAGNDNNAWMAQLMLQGTNFLNYFGRFAYVATGVKGLAAIGFAERNEPEAVIGSDLHKIAYPDNYRQHQQRKLALKEAYEHSGKTVLDVQLRGEYLYAAMGRGGLRIFDVANIDNKDFSERMVTAPVSPLGQRLYVSTRYAMAVAAPSTTAIDPTRAQLPENEEQHIHPMYGFLYVADKYEGLVIVGDASPRSKTPGVSTLLDGEPRNNFLKRALAFNPDGQLTGARRVTLAGVYAYVLCDAGLVVVSLDDPLHPKITAKVGAPELNEPRGVAIQFRYAFVVDRDGLKVLDVTHLDHPRFVPGSGVALADARNITVSRTYAYVAVGKQGVAIIDVERPEHPTMDQLFNASGDLQDTNDIKIGMVSSSQFALVADGHAGFKVLQLFSPQTAPGFYGFSPRPAPRLIGVFRTRGPALAVSRGVDRDRAVDESGNQLSVFGRRGSRPFNLQEMQRLFLRNGELYTVADSPPDSPLAPGKPANKRTISER
ncbi:MAG TPA: hypothetical protein VN176_08800 [Verrucomicrobiae bacterium]|jgi:hypothetical protein|nr:hypothetical protein [Verrucomicrobiae bacterium]